MKSFAKYSISLRRRAGSRLRRSRELRLRCDTDHRLRRTLLTRLLCADRGHNQPGPADGAYQLLHRRHGRPG